jgi:uncharacterized iron-regulated membrane protein
MSNAKKTETSTPDRKYTPEVDKELARRFYLAAWRWHFYTGLYVIPFLLMLAITGLVMVGYNTLESRYGERLYVTPAGELTSPVAQVEAASHAFHDWKASSYMPPQASDRTALIVMKKADAEHESAHHAEEPEAEEATGHGEEDILLVSVNPYTNEVIRDIEQTSTVFNYVSSIHGTLLIGTLGDRLIEIAAGLGIVMVVTGFYMWWPRRATLRDSLLPRFEQSGRPLWKKLHSTVGAYASVLIVFWLISGLAWSGVWGEKFVQPWSTFPAEMVWEGPLDEDKNHASMNHGAEKEVPWGIEQAPMPMSGSDAGHPGIPEGTPVNLASVVALAHELGFGPTFRIALPEDEEGVYTIAADAKGGDITNPTQDRTIHVDQFSGKVVGEVDFYDYPIIAKAMAVSIALHQGDLGWWNVILNVLFCITIIFFCVSGIIMWWKRRPKAAGRLVAPPLPAELPLWKNAVCLMLFLSLAFPMTGIALLTVMLFDILLMQNVKRVHEILQ